jgi:hypothetical protein
MFARLNDKFDMSSRIDITCEKNHILTSLTQDLFVVARNTPLEEKPTQYQPGKNNP